MNNSYIKHIFASTPGPNPPTPKNKKAINITVQSNSASPSAEMNNSYIKHIFASTPGPNPPTPKNKKMKLTLIDHAGLTSNMNFQNIFPESQP